jgi:hypothetical protein
VAEIGAGGEQIGRGFVRRDDRAERTQTRRVRGESTPEMLNLLSDRIQVSRRGSPLLLEQLFLLADGVNPLADRIRPFSAL